MKVFYFVALAFLFAALTGCGQENIKQALSNLDKDCDRDYQVTFGGTFGTMTGAATFHCKHSAMLPSDAPKTTPQP